MIESHAMEQRDPAAPVDVVEVCGAIEFADPYRRLEDQTRSVLEWQRARDAEARRAIALVDILPGLTGSLERHLRACLVSTPKRGGKRWFWHERSLSGDGAVLSISTGLERPRRPMFTTAGISVGHELTIDWYLPSPDGNWVAAGISADGDEQSVLHLINADTGSVVPPRLSHASGGRLAWLPDSSGVYCCAGLVSDTESTTKALFLLRPGASPPERIAIPTPGLDEHLMVQVSSDGRYVGLATNPWCPRICFVLDNESGLWQEALASDDGESFHGVFAGDRYIAVTTRGAPKGRVVSARVESIGDRSSWTELIGEGPGVIRAIAACGRWIGVCEYVERGLRIRLLDSDGREKRSVEMPAHGAVGHSRLEWAQTGTDLPVEMTPDAIVFTFSTPTTPPALYRFDTESLKLARVTEPLCDDIDVRMERRSCCSSDGYEVCFDVFRSGLRDVAGPSPTLIAAYGGWNLLWQTGGYLGMFAPFVEAGGTFVFAHLRGDGTFGTDQWHGGRRACKQRTFDDLYAVAEQLIAEGATTRDRLALYGASNGGLLAGVAITQRPELFRAVVALTPLFDLCRASRERFAELYCWEYGDPRIPEEATWIRDYSPYHNVKTGLGTPATLIVSGSRDIRTHAWHGRKMTAALRAANKSGGPVHLRVHERRGHFTAAAQAPPRVVAEWLGFLMRELGLSGPHGDSTVDREPVALPTR